MARYKPSKYDQMVLVPISFQEQLEPGILEHTLHELVEHHLDLSVFEGRYQNDRTGARAIHPKLLLKVILCQHRKKFKISPLTLSATMIYCQYD